MRLIDADALKRRIIHKLVISDALYLLPGEKAIYEEIEKTPSIDAVPVIRCKDCKHRYIKNDVWTCPFGLMSGPDGYCSWAERKES